MCLLVVARNQSPCYPLVVIANRDERHSRPSAPADYWTGSPGIVGGLDLLAGGTWLAIDQNGRFAAVTNFRGGGIETYPKSRGDLVADYLKSTRSPAEFIRQMTPRLNDYAGFNLLLGQPATPLQYLSNRDRSRCLSRGIHALSNGPLECEWPKIASSRRRLADWLTRDDRNVDGLFEILMEPRSAPAGGPSVEAALQASNFIVGPEYGTRASTCILIDGQGNAYFEERRFDTQGVESGCSVLQFNLTA